GGGKNSCLAQSLSAVEDSLRTHCRNTSSVSATRLCAHLLELRSAVLLGTLSRRSYYSLPRSKGLLPTSGCPSVYYETAAICVVVFTDRLTAGSHSYIEVYDPFNNLVQRLP